jgi:hypothetical protein
MKKLIMLATAVEWIGSSAGQLNIVNLDALGAHSDNVRSGRKFQYLQAITKNSV